MYKEKYTDGNHEHPDYEAIRSVYAVFKHDPNRLNLSIPAALWQKLDETIKKQIVRIRQKIQESKDSKDKDTEKITIGKQYPSLNKPETDVRQTMAALSHIRDCAVSDLFEDDDSIDGMEINNDGLFEHIRHIKMVSAYGEHWDDDDTIDIHADFRMAHKCVQGDKKYMPSQMEELIHAFWETWLN